MTIKYNRYMYSIKKEAHILSAKGTYSDCINQTFAQCKVSMWHICEGLQ